MHDQDLNAPRSNMLTRIVYAIASHPMTVGTIALGLMYGVIGGFALRTFIFQHSLAWDSIWSDPVVVALAMSATGLLVFGRVQTYLEQRRQIIKKMATDARVVEALLGALQERSEETIIRVKAARSLAELRDRASGDVVQVLGAIANQDDDPDVCQAAAVALLLTYRHRLTYAHIIRAFNDLDAAKRKAAVNAASAVKDLQHHSAQSSAASNWPPADVNEGKVAQQVYQGLRTMGVHPPYDDLLPGARGDAAASAKSGVSKWVDWAR